MRIILIVLCMISVLVKKNEAKAQESCNANAIELVHALQKLKNIDRVLYVGAHPDDENNRLLAYLSYGKKATTAYLSLTRGEGGQNFIGSELGEELGILRVQESLSARKIDGGIQFFSRAKDFGFSKTAEETLQFWGEQEVLEDMVWVIRYFKPTLIISRFSSEIPDPHGHHQAVGLLVEKAFAMAANPAVFPAQLPTLGTWQAQQLLWNVYQEAGVKDIGGQVDPQSHYWGLQIPAMNNLLGKSYGDIAADSRNQHRCQAMGNLPNRKASTEYFELLAGQVGQNGSLDLDVSPIYKSASYTKYCKFVDQAIKNFDADEPSKIADKLINLLQWLDKQPHEDWLSLKKETIEALLIQVLGIQFEANSPHGLWCIGDQAQVDLLWSAQGAGKGITLEKIEVPALRKSVVQQLPLQTSGQLSLSGEIDRNLKPYLPPWLREAGVPHRYQSTEISDHILSTLPISPELKVSLVIQGVPLVFQVPIKKVWNDRLLGLQHCPVVLAPQVAVNFLSKNLLITDAEPHEVLVELKALKADNSHGNLALTAPQGWTILPAQVDFNLQKDENKTIRFTVQVAQGQESIGNLGIQVHIDSLQFEQSYSRIEYPHIVKQQFFPAASLRVVRTSIASTAKRIAYIKAKEDKLPTALREFVEQVDELWGDALATQELASYDAIVLGDRLYNVNPQVTQAHARLQQYVENGGVVISLYNTDYDLDIPSVGLLPVQVSNERITDEDAEITFLAKDERVLNYPNALGTNDFSGWIQDRAVFIPTQWDKRFVPVLSSQDKGQKPQNGLLLVAQQGKGYYIYTSLSLFRQLPYGVPGAYKLFANLLSIGK